MSAQGEAPSRGADGAQREKGPTTGAGGGPGPDPIRLEDIAHVAYHVASLDRLAAFLEDFGLHTAQRTAAALYSRGQGSQPYAHVGLAAQPAEATGMAYVALETRDWDELQRAAALPGASAVEPMDGPRPGHRVRLSDPDGFAIHLVSWQHREPARTPAPAAVPGNTPLHKTRLGATVRPARGPARVHRLGHVLLHVSDMARSHAWYTRTLGLRLSDGLTDPDSGRAVAGFYRLAKGEQYVDHHAIGLVEAPAGVAGTIHHASFEVDSFDSVAAGHHWLAARGWHARWGVGRHILGSQVFDYWHDPFGNVVEHYADGDVFDEAAAPGHHPNSVEMLASWAPPYPAPPAAPPEA